MGRFYCSSDIGFSFLTKLDSSNSTNQITENNELLQLKNVSQFIRQQYESTASLKDDRDVDTAMTLAVDS